MKVAVIVANAIFNYLLYFDVSQANYSVKCPERLHWKIRANSKCKRDADKYHCLYDKNNENITEFCASPKDYTAGFMAVYRGNIDADLCPGYRYMPINFKSNMTESCIFLKSTCNGEGQLVHQNWSLAEDATCMCDFSNGFAFIQKPKNNCFCMPLLEDCSCYKKPCYDINYILSPDYDCIVSKLEKTQTSDSHNYQCLPYQDRMRPETCDKIISVLPCLSDVRSTYNKKVPCRDRSPYVYIIIVITTIMVALGLKYLNEDKENNKIDTFDSICQTLESNQEKTTELQTKPDGINIKEHLNEDKENSKIDTSDAICQTLEENQDKTTELQKKTGGNNINACDYFIINCQHSILQFYDGKKLNIGFNRKPRILDMCFLKLDSGIHLVYIDADNKTIVIRDISKENGQKDETLSKTLEPNRICKLDNSTVGVIFKKGFQILIFDIKKMEPTITYSISQSDIMEDCCIQGILAFSQTELILTDKIRLYHCELHEHDKTTKVQSFAPLNSFDTARRLTHVTVSPSSFKEVIFVADENDKKLTSIERTSEGNYIDTQEDQNRGLQNVRAIGATEHRVYAATSAGISVFCHDNGYFKKFKTRDNGIADYRMIVEYYKHVEHTRGLCIQLDNDHIFIGLSCIIKQEDVILIFKFKPDDIFK